jgi:proliferating cell nuclear antigen
MNNVLEIKTVQISPFKTLVTGLKDILIETNIIFKEDGIHIVNFDKSHMILVNLHLQAENFEHYEIKKPKIVIGVNMFHLFKIISSIENDDTLSIVIDEDDYNDGIVKNLTIVFENGIINQCRTYKLKLIEPDDEELSFPNIQYSSVINIPSSDFQKIVRDLSYLQSDKVEIKSVGNELIFSLEGSFAKVQIRRSENDGSLEYVKSDDSIIQGEFVVRYLGYFIKCTNLCSCIELMIENDKPLVVKYDVASLGAIKLCLSPIQD